MRGLAAEVSTLRAACAAIGKRAAVPCGETVDRIRGYRTDVRRIVELVRTEQEAAGLEYHAGIVLYPRFAIHISLLVYALANEAKARQVYDLYAEMVVEAAKMGYGEYRAHLAFMDLVAEQYGYNGQSLLRLVESLKDAVDPNGILAPGKQGIWPGRSRS